MFQRLSRSWALVKASATVLQQNKQLLVFPVISLAAMLVVIACFALPAIGFDGFDGLERGGRGGTPLQYSVAFLFYVCAYFVIFYFNAALVGATMIRLDGGTPTVGDGLRIANSRLGPIFGYAVIAATVGIVLRMIQERVGFLGRFIVGLLGVGWTVATYLVVPVLVSQEVGPIQSIKDSASLLKRTWGENVIGQAGLGVAFGMIHLAVIACGVMLIMTALWMEVPALAIAILVVLIFAVLFVWLVHSALTGIYSAALYRYAANGESSTGFDNQALQAAFMPKK